MMMMKFGITTFSVLALFQPDTVFSQPDDTFKGCSVPEFSWATYSTSTTARMYAMRGAIAGNHVFVAGLVKSTIDTDNGDDTEEEFTLTGPYSVQDPTGQNAETITVDIGSYSALAGAKENAGGSFGQYEIGLAKINKLNGKPEEFLVIKGDAMDETTGLAAKDDAVVISGHFTGNLTTDLADGSTQTIWNSNVGEGGIADNADQFHPNQKDAGAFAGKDDGFVIKLNSETGAADWMVHYPQTNQDAQITSVDLDDDLNVFGSGYSCTLAEGAERKVCDAFVAMFASKDGALVWEKSFPELGALFFIKYDREDAALYVAGTTTFSGGDKDAKQHPHCPDASCSVVMRLDSTDGSIKWIRTVKGSARWGVFDQSGGLELADEEKDGPYIYVALDDTGEGDVERAYLNRGTSYGGCMDEKGVFTPEYHVFLKKVVGQEDCDFYDDTGKSRYISREAEEALPASSVENNVHCGNNGGSDACLMKFHKHTGLPTWAVDVPPVAGLVPSVDGLSIDIAGWYYPGRAEAYFDSVVLPGYLREGGLGSQTSGVYNARLSATTGKGEYVVHSGGGSKDRLYDMVGAGGDLYNIGYHMNLRTQWGSNLETIMAEQDVDPANAGSEAVETHMYVSKLEAQSSSQVVPSCLKECTGNTDDAVIAAGTCFIDGKCYDAGDTAKIFGKSCFVCDPGNSQRNWSEGPTLGSSQCFVDNVCVDSGDYLFYQRRTWSGKVYSTCQVCSPEEDPKAWSLTSNEFVVVDGKSPPDDCVFANSTEAPTGTVPPVPAPVPDPTNAPVPLPTPVPVEPGSILSIDEISDDTLSDGAIVGIVLGSLVILFVIVIVVNKLQGRGHEKTEMESATPEQAIREGDEIA